MADGMYEVLALLPESSDFTLDAAVAHFGRHRFGNRGRTLLRAELAVPPGKRKPAGFRVFFGEWAVVAWLESGRGVRSESKEFAADDDLPAPPEVIAGCSRRLSVWSDPDDGFLYSDEFTEVTKQLRVRFGALILDCVNGCWWT